MPKAMKSKKSVPEQLLGVHGPAMRDASSHLFIRMFQHEGHPHPVLSRPTTRKLRRDLTSRSARHRLAHAQTRWKQVQKRDCIRLREMEDFANNATRQGRKSKNMRIFAGTISRTSSLLSAKSTFSPFALPSSSETPQPVYAREDDNIILMYIEFGMAQKYVDDLSKNVKRGLKTKIENGWYSGKAPAGYLNNTDKLTGENTLVKDPERFPLIRRMWDLMLTGLYTPPKILEIANTEWGLRTRITRRILDGPILELLGDTDAGKVLIDLLFQFQSGHAFLRTQQWPSAFRAMVIGVMEKQRVLHFFNRRLATRTCILPPIRKFEFAVAAQDLMFFLGCHRPATVPATDEAGEGKFVLRLCAGIPITAQQRLHPVIFRFGDHWLVLSLIPLAASVRIFKPAVIEGLGENLVNGASDKRFGYSSFVVRTEGFLDNSGCLRGHGLFWIYGFGENKR